MIGEENRTKDRFIAYPTSFWSERLPPRFGNCGVAQDFCLNWKLEVDPRPIPLTASPRGGHQFGEGLITILSMDSFAEDIKSGIPFNEERERGQLEPSFVPFLTGRSEISKGVIHLFRELSNLPSDIFFDEESSADESVGVKPVNGEQIETDVSTSEADSILIDLDKEIADGELGIQHSLAKKISSAVTTPAIAFEKREEKMKVYRHLASPNDNSSSLGVIYEFMGLSVVLILAIPSSFSPSDFLHFIGKENVKRISKMRLLRDAAPNRYMALIKFVNNKSARIFFTEKDGVNFLPYEPEVCHAVFVKSVEFSTNVAILEPLFDETEYAGKHPQLNPTMESLDFIEIPTCPVCLEKIDGSATGVMIVICNHRFHCECLLRWGDGSCPVCRFSLPVENKALARSKSCSCCSICGATSNIWLCLICGNTGCGRYERGHANNHYCETGHNFALEIDSHRVWDYLGDKYFLFKFDSVDSNPLRTFHFVVMFIALSKVQRMEN